ncbi:hypothetical protein BFW01_g4189 [Lasiodiplodia theobromae]|uniref:DUF4038 domain-containing protein n=1 Tax=Lasiodiplodia theobromae TaxID=45133 RepID=A0A5N5D9E7_9PEZI|nr:uncharacterized protein LTHEOB_11794 [Lasiodiplodia theobromae]KAB2574443.1 hypothetical protein DBV05_g6863 [Lasiodiplodia theobromae]KAF4536926.1 hypothetical protein LTHEOB_11794 [Lasiodiplodia theobromae]KAF9633295.1 hypothetical protein BFW01_g4189 [Lasiodiplodia theobromae]
MRPTSSVLALLSLGGACASAQNSTAVPWSHLSISASGRYLYRTSSGEPFFWQADTAWELFHRLNRSDIDYYLQDRASKGFNVVQAVVLSELNGTTFPNFYGELALHDADPTRPNEAYFAHVDWAVKRAAEYGILIALVPTWGRWVNCGWHNGPIIFNETSAETFGSYIGERYPGLPKIIGGDSNGFWSCNASAAQDAFREDPTIDPTTLLGPITDTRSVWTRMVEGFKVAESKAGFTPFYTWHPTNMWVSTPDTGLPYGHNYMNGSFGEVSMDAVQSGHNIPDNNTVDTHFDVMTGWDSTANYENIIDMREAFAGPVIDLENHYEGAYVGFNTSRPLWNASYVRHGFYNAYLSGSCGFTYGANAIWQMYAPVQQLARADLWIEPQIAQPTNESWRDALRYPGATQSGYVQKLFSTLDRDTLESLQPNRSFILSPSDEADVLTYTGNRYVAGLASNSQYWVYAGYGDAFDLDLGALAGHFGKDEASASARWYDPRQGEYRNTTGNAAFDLTGRKAFVPPTSGGVDHDWILHLKID